MQKAEVADCHHAIGQDVREEPAEQRHDVQGSGAAAGTAHFPGGAGDRAIRAADETVVGESDREDLGGKGRASGGAVVVGPTMAGPGDGPCLRLNLLQQTRVAHVCFAERPGDGGERFPRDKTVKSPPPPSWHRILYHLVYGETEEVVPGHVELVSVLWELGILPDIRILPLHTGKPIIPAPTREAAIAGEVARFGGDQWALWPLGSGLEQRLRDLLEARFDERFAAGPDGFIPRWITPGREILITWQPNTGSE